MEVTDAGRRWVIHNGGIEASTKEQITALAACSTNHLDKYDVWGSEVENLLAGTVNNY